MKQSDTARAGTRIWASRDHSIAAPVKRTRAHDMRLLPTEAERKLWLGLRRAIRAAHFRRQALIAGYIVDFVSHKTKLIVEVDGGQHSVQTTRDAARTRALNAHEYRVLRYWNNDVLRNLDGVLEDIQRTITTTPTPNPSPQGGGE